MQLPELSHEQSETASIDEYEKLVGAQQHLGVLLPAASATGRPCRPVLAARNARPSFSSRSVAGRP